MSFEADLLRRARKFDPQALAEIYDCYSSGVYGYALRLLGKADLSEDCVAETFHRFLQALRDGKGPKDYVRAYLYRTAHNWVTDQFRRQPPVLPLDELPEMSAASTPHEIVMQNCDAECLRQALFQLTPDQRQVIVLKYLEDWTNDEVAAALGKPVGAVKSLQHRALASLQRHMDSEERE